MKIQFLETSYMASSLLIGIGIAVALALLGVAWLTHSMQQKLGFYIVLAVLVAVVGIFSFIAAVALTVQIDERGVEYKFFPFINTPVLIVWKDIKSAEVITYNPMQEYGGWGLRANKKGKAYSTKGDKGLQIVLHNGDSILFSIIDVEKAKQTIMELKASFDASPTD